MSIEAMKMALEALEFNGNIWHIDCKKDDSIAVLRQAIEQAAKQEPYGYLWFTHHIERRFTHYKPKEEQRIGDVKPVYAQPVDAVNMKQERVDETAKCKHEPWCDSVTKLLTSMPPQIPPCNCKPKREWVGLTDEEIETIVNNNTYDDSGYDIWCHGKGVARDIEAKLKEKNRG